MDFLLYRKNSFECLIPRVCRIKSDAPIVTASSKRHGISLIIEIDPAPSILAVSEELILSVPPVSVGGVQRTTIRQGKGNTSRPGIESAVRIQWEHNKSEEFSWRHILKVVDHDVVVDITAPGRFEDHEQDWLKVVNSISFYS